MINISGLFDYLGIKIMCGGKFLFSKTQSTQNKTFILWLLNPN